MENKRNLRKERVGVVVSNKMDKSIVVAVERKVNIQLRKIRQSYNEAKSA